MATAAVKGAARATRSDSEFRSGEELCDVLDALLSEVDEDPDFGPRMRAANLPHRAVYPDLGVVLNIAAAPDRGEHCLRWSFSEEDDWDPTLTMVMDSRVANRFLQGRVNFAIAVARGEIRVSCAEPGAAMDFLPLSVGLIARYRGILKASFPHLLIG
ncbi:MAG: hypothetical protein ACXWZM_00520 [Solirubrobacterales bacterium]